MCVFSLCNFSKPCFFLRWSCSNLSGNKSKIYMKTVVNVRLLIFTLEDSHQSRADTWHNVIEEPLPDPVELHPPNHWQKRQSSTLGSFRVTPKMTHKLTLLHKKSAIIHELKKEFKTLNKRLIVVLFYLYFNLLNICNLVKLIDRKTTYSILFSTSTIS